MNIKITIEVKHDKGKSSKVVLKKRITNKDNEFMSSLKCAKFLAQLVKEALGFDLLKRPNFTTD